MFFSLAFFIVAYCLSATIFGIAAFAVSGQRLQKMNTRIAILLFTLLFAVADSWYIPLLANLDITLKIANADIRQLFNLPDGDIPLSELLKFRTFDVIGWICQAVLAYFVGLYVYQTRNLTRRSS